MRRPAVCRPVSPSTCILLFVVRRVAVLLRAFDSFCTRLLIAAADAPRLPSPIVNAFIATKASASNMATPKKSTPKRAAAAAKKTTRSAKAGLIFPVARIGSLLRKGQYASRVSASSAVYAAAVLEYLTAELLELSASALAAGAKKGKKLRRISPRTITVAVRSDADLGSLLKDVTISRGGVLATSSKALAGKKGKKATATPSA